MSEQPLSPWDSLRPTQREVIGEYPGGRMGISAVPGSGKTYTLSMLAADTILEGNLDLSQEVLIVTMSNSAVNNFTQRIGSVLQREGLMAGMNYRVRTLHGLAHDIVRERPSLVNLANDFSIIDDGEANAILEQVIQAWMRANPHFFASYLREDIKDYSLEKIYRKALPEMVKSIARSLIGYAKDCELTPIALRQRLDALPASLPLADMACSIYQEYQRSLNYRGAVDFADLIRLALMALRSDPALLQRLQTQWPYILEDEAQDSSRLQQEILRMLTGEKGNWVRVGDPNQAIYETFTTANPQHLIDFIHSPGVLRKELPVSGRSSHSIIRLANHLIDWTRDNHPVLSARDALHPPYILPTDDGDPQPNPPDRPDLIHFSPRKQTPREEMDRVVSSLVRWQEGQNELPENERETLVVLDLSNERGTDLVNMLRERGLDPHEILGTTTSTRLSAGTLSHILRYLSNPQSVPLLGKIFRVWRRGDRENPEAQPLNKRTLEHLNKIRRIEDYLYPLPGADWLETSGLAEQDPLVCHLLGEFRVLVRRWHGAALLPIDQVILTLAQDLFDQPADLAIAHKLAAVLRRTSDSHPGWQLPQLSEELEVIARNKRRFLGFSDDDNGFDPNKYRGRVVVTTMHKAKGLEWDRVYMLAVNNYNFPSNADYDQYHSEKWFVRDKLNMEAEALEQLKVALSRNEYIWYIEGQASLIARLDCVRERLRLLFVGITRAKHALVLTYNTGRNGDQQAALPFLELQSYWEKQHVT
jgi:DNA helicase II / ATP-dependent DNA helicase PcrA